MSSQTVTSVAQILREAEQLSGDDLVGAKLAILPMGVEHPDGYQVIEVMNGNFNIDQFSENECVEILAPNILNLVDYQKLNGVIISLLSKLRTGGVMMVGGTDTDMVARAIINKTLDVEALNSHIYNSSAITNLTTTREFLSSIGLEILSASYNGLNYEIRARRSTASN
tara:strand:- start:1287 stop:1793 length:507 start_codon:yes stop_codon:yes gene_type:complete